MARPSMANSGSLMPPASSTFCNWRSLRRRGEMHHLTRLLGGSNLAAQLAHDAGGALDKLGVAHRQNAVAEIDIILHSHADVSAQRESHGAQWELIFTDADDLPGRAFRNSVKHGQKIGGRCRNCTLDAEHEAEVQRRDKSTALHEVERVLDVA